MTVGLLKPVCRTNERVPQYSRVLENLLGC